jgi:vancomycin permeability regulator SanA
MNAADVVSQNAPRSVSPKIVRALIWLALLLFLYWLATFVDVWVASNSDDDVSAPAAIVLGAAQYNGEPSPVLKSRLDRALELYESGAVKLVVVTGGNQAGDITTEAKTGYDYLRSAGIPDDDLLLEVQGISTYESVGASARILRDRDITSAVLVTNAYHSRRTQLVAEEFGMEPQVSLVGDASFGRLFKESVAVSIGRVTSFRRLDWVS